MGEEMKNVWVLTDWYGSPYGDVEKPQTVINSADQLHQLLTCNSHQEPRMLHFECCDDPFVHIGLGGQLAAVYFRESRDSKEALFALSPTKHSKESLSFMYDFQDWLIAPRHLLLPEDVIDVTLCIYKTKQLPVRIQWERLRLTL